MATIVASNDADFSVTVNTAFVEIGFDDHDCNSEILIEG
jgi:hypothetical protein